MMSWETELMKEHARLICHNKGSVLNVGHGMGIVDRAIQVSLAPKWASYQEADLILSAVF